MARAAAAAGCCSSWRLPARYRLFELLCTLACGNILVLVLFHTVTMSSSSSSSPTATTSRADDATTETTTTITTTNNVNDDFSMQNTPDCARHLRGDHLREIAAVEVDAWMLSPDNHNDTNSSSSPSSSLLLASKNAWRNLVEACHGPLPPELYYPEDETTTTPTTNNNNNLMDPTALLAGLLQCGHDAQWRTGGSPGLFGGQWCSERWHKSVAPPSFFKSRRSYYVQHFVATAKCMLQLEFPLVPPPSQPSSLPNDDDNDTNHYQILLVTVAAHSCTLQPACDLVASAAARGWDVTVGLGRDLQLQHHWPPWRYFQRFRLSHKYHYANQLVRGVLQERKLNPERTVLVFLDAYDALANLEPEQVLASFRQQGRDFLWSSEEKCFPMGFWPHSMVRAWHTCDALLPKASTNATVGHRRNHPQFVNSGGWIGIATAALQILEELSALSIGDSGTGQCFRFGTDQLLGNALLLRHQSSGRVGLDVDSRIFVSNAQKLFREGHLQEITIANRSDAVMEGRQLPSVCSVFSQQQQDGTAASSAACSAFLHFNGCGKKCLELPQVQDILVPPWVVLSSSPGQVSVFRFDDSSLTTVSDLSICQRAT